jgi:hypothetical protein
LVQGLFPLDRWEKSKNEAHTSNKKLSNDFRLIVTQGTHLLANSGQETGDPGLGVLQTEGNLERYLSALPPQRDRGK